MNKIKITDFQFPLPKKPSKLLKFALKHLKAIEKNTQKYEVYMSNLHVHTRENKCLVCLAGSIIAEYFPNSDKSFYQTTEFKGNTYNAFEALDQIRKGKIDEFLRALKIDIKKYDIDNTYYMPLYSEGKKEFKRGIKEIIRKLKAVGL